MAHPKSANKRAGSKASRSLPSKRTSRRTKSADGGAFIKKHKGGRHIGPTPTQGPPVRK